MENLTVKPVGIIRADADGMRIELDKAYIPAMRNMAGRTPVQS